MLLRLLEYGQGELTFMIWLVLRTEEALPLLHHWRSEITPILPYLINQVQVGILAQRCVLQGHTCFLVYSFLVLDHPVNHYISSLFELLCSIKECKESVLGSNGLTGHHGLYLILHGRAYGVLWLESSLESASGHSFSRLIILAFHHGAMKSYLLDLLITLLVLDDVLFSPNFLLQHIVCWTNSLDFVYLVWDL